MAARRSRLSSRRSGAYGSMQDQVYDFLQNAIKIGTYKKDDILPSIREIAKHFGNSITPVNQALIKLEGEGFIEKIHGVGVRVRSNVPTNRSPRTKPLIHCIAAFSTAPTKPDPGTEAMVDAIHEWLVYNLSFNSDIRFSMKSIVSSWDNEEFSKVLLDASELRPAAVVFSRPETFNETTMGLLSQLQESGVRIAHYCAFKVLPNADAVMSDFAQGQYDLTTHLLNKGHRKIVRLSFDLGRLYEQEKRKGFARAYAEAGLNPEDTYKSTYIIPQFHSSYHDHAFYQWKEFLGDILAKDNPDAIMCTTDFDAADARIALKKMGIKTPVEITGYDSLWTLCHEFFPGKYGQKDFEELCDFEHAPVSVHRELTKVGTELAELVTARVLDKLPPEAQLRKVPQRLVIPTA